MITKTVPKDKKHWLELRAKDVTSTEASALFGLSPYMTEFELWHTKKSGDIITLEENERMKWGNKLEPVIAQTIAEDNDWDIRPMDEYISLDSHRMGSSFDFAIGDHGILEIKNVDGLVFRDKWVVEDGQVVEAPPHIEIQCQHQLAVSGRSLLYIGALVGGNQLAMIKRERDENIIKMIKSKVMGFWSSIHEGVEPKPNFENDGEFISKLYSNTDPDKIIDLTENDETTEEYNNLVLEYTNIVKEEKILAKKKSGAKAKLLMKMGDAEKVKAPGFSIAAGMIKEADISYTRKPYRSFKVYTKKEKTK